MIPERPEQIQYREDFQTADQHLEHAGHFQDAREGRVVGHRTHVAEAGADVADAGDGGHDTRREILSEGDVDGSEDDYDQQITEDIAVGLTDLCIRLGPAVDPYIIDGIRRHGQPDLPVNALGGQAVVSCVANPVVVEMEATWKDASRSALPKEA